ncbi:MAG: phosphotransferase [Chloroflexi bacterium]|nr:phosphotransferase [Chloroflexota bacterium]MYB17328.1 phosphotransferase [Chloroflexota bacterium]
MSGAQAWRPELKSGRPRPLDSAVVQPLLDRVAPGHRLASVTPAGAAYTNRVHIVRAVSPRGHEICLVIKQLTDSLDAERATAEFRGLEIAHRHGIPVPEPLLLDASGSELGVPGLVTGFVAGAQVMRPKDVAAWAEAMADALLAIHDIAPSADERDGLYDGEAIGLYFLSGHWPAANARHPLSEQIYGAIEELRPELECTRQAFLHMDFWPGNVLWDRDRIAAIVDWDGAAVGDRAVDVGNFRMEMHLRGIKEAADIFLRRYEAGAGAVKNLAFWELAAAARPLPDPFAWLLDPPAGADSRELLRNFNEFVAGAAARIRRGRD